MPAELNDEHLRTISTFGVSVPVNGVAQTMLRVTLATCVAQMVFGHSDKFDVVCYKLTALAQRLKDAAELAELSSATITQQEHTNIS